MLKYSYFVTIKYLFEIGIFYNRVNGRDKNEVAVFSGLENIIIGSSRAEGFYKKGAFRNFIKFLGKHLYQGLFFNKVADQVCNFIKK